MVKNNLKALLIHIIISFFTIFSLLFTMGTAKWASEEAAIKHHNHMMLVRTTIIVIALILYYLSGIIFLTIQENIVKNLPSAILIIIIGPFIWVIINKDIENYLSYLLISFVPTVVMTFGLLTKSIWRSLHASKVS